MTERLQFDSYRQWAEGITPSLRSALSGEREVPPQAPFSETWLAFALYDYSRLLSLEEVIESADSINHAIPSADEVSWAFIRLRERGWLVAQGDLYGLTEEGRMAIGIIVNEGAVDRLQKWISTNPSPVSIDWVRRFVQKKSGDRASTRKE